MALALHLPEITIIDNHCHPSHRRQPETDDEFRRYFTESRDSRIVSDHVQHTLFTSKAFETWHRFWERMWHRSWSDAPGFRSKITSRSS